MTTENRRSVIGDAVYDLRFLALNQEEFAKHVSKSGLLTAEELVPIYEKFSNLPSSLLKWTLSKREVYDPTLKMLRICRFSVFAKNTVLWPYRDGVYSCAYGDKWQQFQDCERDYLSFSVDQFALFLGVRFFSSAPIQPDTDVRRGEANRYDVNLRVNVAGMRSYTVTGTYDPQKAKKRSIPGFDVMFESPILLQGNDVVKMNAAIEGPPSPYGRRGKSTVKVRGMTVNFMDSEEYNTRTCVSQGQFHQIILSV